jgi:hypothetical protein
MVGTILHVNTRTEVEDYNKVSPFMTDTVEIKQIIYFLCMLTVSCHGKEVEAEEEAARDSAWRP